jgi:hypothetical protein
VPAIGGISGRAGSEEIEINSMAKPVRSFGPAIIDISRKTKLVVVAQKDSRLTLTLPT